LAFLTACSSLPAVPTPHRLSDFTGRLSVRIEATTFSTEKSFSASFSLAGSDAQGHIELTSAIGTMLAQARWMPQGAWLATPQGESVYPSMPQLTREVFGEAIPIAPWFDWLRGQPWAGAASEPRPDNLPGFVQDGWTVDLVRQSDRLIVARREQPPAVTLRIKLDESN
jgi:outer membrane lipoprotein LolB